MNFRKTSEYRDVSVEETIRLLETSPSAGGRFWTFIQGITRA